MVLFFLFPKFQVDLSLHPLILDRVFSSVPFLIPSYSSLLYIVLAWCPCKLWFRSRSPLYNSRVPNINVTSHTLGLHPLTM